MKICALSDIHCGWNEIEMPDADICIIAGDALSVGTEKELIDFNNWCGLIRGKYKYGIHYTPGNHDNFTQNHPEQALEILTNCHYHVDESITVDGIKIYFTPWVPMFGPWAWMKVERELEEIYNKIPNDTDVIVCHGMPYSINDMTMRGRNYVGSMSLYSKIEMMPTRKRLFFGGHIHGWFDNSNNLRNKTPRQLFDCTFYNVSIMDEDYDPIFTPTVVDYV